MENRNYRDSFVLDMEEWKGEVLTISSVDKKYRVAETGWNWTDEMFEGIAEDDPHEFHEFDTVKHTKYGIGTVVKVLAEINKVKVDFDNWNEDFVSETDNYYFCSPDELTLVQTYVPN